MMGWTKYGPLGVDLQLPGFLIIAMQVTAFYRIKE